MRALRRSAVFGLTAGLAVASGAALPGPAAAADEPAITRVSTDSKGRQLHNGAYAAQLSANGEWLAFESFSKDVVPEDANGTGRDVFVKNLDTGQVVLANTNAAGEQGNERSYGPALSANGRYVAFSTESSNLVPTDVNGRFDAYLKDLRTGAVTLVADRADGVPAELGSFASSLSADGTKVGFSSASSLDPGHPFVPDLEDPVLHSYLKNLTTGEITLLSVTDAGVIGDDDSGGPTLSADGSTAAFVSRAGNLGLNERYYAGHTFIKDLETGELMALENLVDLDLPEHNFASGTSLSGDGSLLAFTVFIDRLAEADVPVTDRTGIFVADLRSGEVTHTVTTAEGTLTGSGSAVLSRNGRHLAFTSFKDNLVADDVDDGVDVFVQDLKSGRITRLSVSTKSKGDLQFVENPSISASGRKVVFEADTQHLGKGRDTNGKQDIYLAKMPR